MRTASPGEQRSSTAITGSRFARSSRSIAVLSSSTVISVHVRARCIIPRGRRALTNVSSRSRVALNCSLARPIERGSASGRC